jgi:2-octaprenylphenol hydroxylase
VQADIVIVGAGMVGSLLAASLQHLSLNIVVIDQIHATEPNNQAPYEPRVSALTRASQNMLSHVGAWSLVKQKRYAPFSTMQVREQEGHGELLFSAYDVGVSHLGCLVENNLLQWALTQCAVQGGVKLIVPDKVVVLERLTQQWQVTLASGTVITTPLVVGADGAFSAIRQLVGIGIDSWDYQQQAIVCTVKTQQPHQECARQVFLRSGPLAFLPLPDANYCSIVWSAKNEEATRILALSDDAFKAELSRHFAQELGEIEWCDTRYAFPLIARHAQRYFLEGLALVGDAAHTIHPLAGQGVNLGFLDAAVLAEEIEHSLKRGLALGNMHSLSRYSRRRRPHNALVMHSMTALERAYALKQPALVVARNEAVRQVNHHLWLKGFFEKHAMGLVGDLPKIAY